MTFFTSGPTELTRDTRYCTDGQYASGQYSCPRLNTTVLGHDTGLISKDPFHDTFINQYTNV